MDAKSHNRRCFLRAAGGALAAVSIPLSNAQPLLLRYSGGRPRIAFIGLGSNGLLNLGWAVLAAGIDIEALCDSEPGVLQDALRHAQRLGLGALRTTRNYGDVLSDPSVDVACIATGPRSTSHIAMQAIHAGKDVYLAAPVSASLTESGQLVRAARRHGRMVQLGNIWRSIPAWQRAREVVRSGQLGRIVLCRTLAGTPASLSGRIDGIQFVLDDPAPLSVSAQGSGANLLATFRYPEFIAGYECRAGAEESTVICGTDATLAIPPPSPVSDTGEPTGVLHWRDFLESIRSRRKPVADIETCIHSAAAAKLMELALREGCAVDWCTNTEAAWM